MSEFSTLTTKLITPIMREKGFRKRGRFSRSPMSDSVGMANCASRMQAPE